MKVIGLYFPLYPFTHSPISVADGSSLVLEEGKVVAFSLPLDRALYIFNFSISLLSLSHLIHFLDCSVIFLSFLLCS